jgi:cellulose synthase/poly-beta-1,6-N-acetylglucosamine synthase-like glycosyltransferase
VSPHPLALSVIVPARNEAETLPWSLGALLRSDLPRQHWELIVVDDASGDATAEVARRYADRVIELPGPRPFGPAYARNRAAAAARGEILAFIDADVCVHTDTLRRFADLFRDDPGVGAAFGSYDANPTAPGLVSQYRNLLHHHVHQRSGGDADTFWAGCGAVRHSVFVEADMFDEWHYSRPQIEDIELGARIRSLGHRIVLRPEIQATHRKQWTLGAVIRTDLLDRGVPWTRLLVQRGSVMRTATLNLKRAEKVKTVLVWGAAACATVALPARDWRWLIAAAVLLQRWRLRLLRAGTRVVVCAGDHPAANALLPDERRVGGHGLAGPPRRGRAQARSTHRGVHGGWSGPRPSASLSTPS